ncbi:MAG TPA: glycosyltransferase [Candidatus Bathyarchaeia archaeon]|nr:glycosyltransferase [Candidatus Bathyarchaeia archaeon]
MKILMITPYLPYPPFSGGQVRSYHLIKNLAHKHQIFLISLVKNNQEKKYIKELEKFCARVWAFDRPSSPWTLRNIIRTGFSFDPFLVVRNFSALAKKKIKEEIAKENFDLIHAETFYVMSHIPPTKIPILLVEQTIECQVYDHFVKTLPYYLFFLKPFLYFDIFKLEWWEKFYWRKADLVAAVSESDQKMIIQLVKKVNVRVVPNGVDCNYFSKKVTAKEAVPTVVFVGNFKWLQNKEAVDLLVKKIWPLIVKKNQQVRLLIVGRHSEEFVRVCDPRIRVKKVRDIREAYQTGWVFIAPFRSGGGSRLKIFEAMASGLPVVATAKGVEGIRVKNGVHYLKGETSQELATNVIRLINNRELALKIAFAARRLTSLNYDWQISAKKLDNVYREITNGKN